jgi:hypothetical protein
MSRFMTGIRELESSFLFAYEDPDKSSNHDTGC